MSAPFFDDDPEGHVPPHQSQTQSRPAPGTISFLHDLELSDNSRPAFISDDMKHDIYREQVVSRSVDTTHVEQHMGGHHWDVETSPRASYKELHLAQPSRKELQVQLPSNIPMSSQHRKTLDTLVIITPPSTSSPLFTQHIENPYPTSPQPLMTAPFFIEHGTSFVCTTTISSVMNALSRVLDRMHVDYTRRMDKNKIKGVFHNGALSCPFQIRLYRSSDDNNSNPSSSSPSSSAGPSSSSAPQSILVEFQRRHGCPITFHSFYQQTSELFWEELESPSSSSKSQATPDSINKSPIDDASVVLLYGMASSQYHDVQKEGLRALAHVSYTDENQVKLSHMSATSLSTLPLAAAPSPSTLSLLQHVLSSNDQEMRRIASILVTNLSHQDIMRTPIVSELLDAMVTILESPVTIESRESQRQVLKALAIMSETHTPALANYRSRIHAQSLSTLLLKHEHSTDVTIQTNVKLLLHRLQGF